MDVSKVTGRPTACAAVIAAIGQHVTRAGGAHFVEGDFLAGWSSSLAVLAHFDPGSIGEIGDLHDLASGVIGGPFPDLFSVLEVA